VTDGSLPICGTYLELILKKIVGFKSPFEKGGIEGVKNSLKSPPPSPSPIKGEGI
jgi:hypothetical protein